MACVCGEEECEHGQPEIDNECEPAQEGVMENKILMQCVCKVTGEIKDLRGGKPEGWYSIDVEGPGLAGMPVRISQVLCPACFLLLGVKWPGASEKAK